MTHPGDTTSTGRHNSHSMSIGAKTLSDDSRQQSLGLDSLSGGKPFTPSMKFKKNEATTPKALMDN